MGIYRYFQSFWLHVSSSLHGFYRYFLFRRPPICRIDSRLEKTKRISGIIFQSVKSQLITSLTPLTNYGYLSVFSKASGFVLSAITSLHGYILKKQISGITFLNQWNPGSTKIRKTPRNPSKSQLNYLTLLQPIITSYAKDNPISLVR